MDYHSAKLAVETRQQRIRQEAEQARLARLAQGERTPHRLPHLRNPFARTAAPEPAPSGKPVPARSAS